MFFCPRISLFSELEERVLYPGADWRFLEDAKRLALFGLGTHPVIVFFSPRFFDEISVSDSLAVGSFGRV